MKEFLVRIATQYCERTGNTFLSEPLNLVSNIAFFISAYFTYKLLKKHKIKDKSYLTLVVLLILIGAGSALWHSFRHPYTLLLDALPIFAFFLLFIYLILKKLLQSSNKSLILLSAFFCVQVVLSYLFPNLLNGSIRHVFNGIVFGLLGTMIYIRNKNIRRELVAGLLLYVLAIVSRSVDNSICAYFSIGTHFLWHILNTAAAYYAVRILIKVKPLLKS